VIKCFTVSKGRGQTLYEYIVGTVESISPQYIVVDNNGIGYQIFTPNPYLFQKDGKKQKVYIYFHVREDAQVLYGFKSKEEKEFFTKLLSVSGIGPKGALAILASGEPAEIAMAIEEENETFLTKFPGVGKKTARQIILDLKGKLQEFLMDISVPGESPETMEEGQPELEEALLALRALGYSEKEIQRITPLLKNETLKTEQYIKLALKLLTAS